MRFRGNSIVAFFVLLVLLTGPLTAQLTESQKKQNASEDALSIGIMSWNIWHGGREDGEDMGPNRVVDIIRDSNVDLVAMQETYGSGELISKALKFHFHPRGTNVSIHSRFPVVEDISVFEEFKCVGALVELPNKRHIAFYSIWLPYNKEIWEAGTRDTSDPQSMLAACQASCDDLEKIRTLIKKRLADKKYQKVPIVIAGDFNSMSHVDYISSSTDQYKVKIDWPTSRVMSNNGFRDSWREIHPEVSRKLDRTWTPRFTEQEQDRIDYIYYRGENLVARESKVIDKHAEKFPSDHAALVTRFDWLDDSVVENRLRVASYNIRHCEGTDRKLDVGRTAALLDNLNADIIGLQEVDNQAKRSGSVDQASTLAKSLGFKSAFGSFMDFQGGRYGMAILSRYPILKQQSVKLPKGNEPRIALACEIQLPNGQVVTAVNVHFDWVRDDAFRFAQARELAMFLSKLEMPYLLLGDFNDTFDSRTLKLLSKNSLLAEKPSSDHFTFSSTKPSKEIDFIMASPPSKWRLLACRLCNAPKTSDHRPVVSEWQIIAEK